MAQSTIRLRDAVLRLGVIASRQGDAARALEFFDRALAVDPEHALAHFNRGYVLHSLQQWEAALASYASAIALEPDFAPAHSNRGAALVALHRFIDARASLDRALELRPDYPEAHFSLAILSLLQGDFAQGWTEYEWRWQTAGGRALRRTKNFSSPMWLGEEPIAGKTVLLHCERGLGDTLQFCRYAEKVAQLGAKVILQVQEPLVALLRCLPPQITVRGEAEPLPPFDLQCPLLSLPLAFKTSLNTIPAAEKYLSANPEELTRQQARLGARTKPRVGLIWRGDPANPDDRSRSTALSDLLRYLPSGLQYFSLQKEITPAEAGLIRENPRVALIADGLNFEQTAALCECLDLVISIDSSVAHLAAALGRETWILLPFSPDCRWMLNRGDSPWYPSVKLYRQAAAGDWHTVFAAVAAGMALKWTAQILNSSGGGSSRPA